MSTAEMAQNIFICLSLVTKSLLSRPPSPGYTCRVLRSSFHRSSPPTPPYVCLVCIGYGRSFGAHSGLAELYITAMTLPHICFASLFCFTPLPPFPFRVAVYASGARFVVSREWLKGTILRNSWISILLSLAMWSIRGWLLVSFPVRSSRFPIWRADMVCHFSAYSRRSYHSYIRF